MSDKYEKWCEEAEKLGLLLYNKYAEAGEVPLLDWMFLSDDVQERVIGAAVQLRKHMQQDLLRYLDVSVCYERYAERHRELGGMELPLWEDVPTGVRLCIGAALDREFVQPMSLEDKAQQFYEAGVSTSGYEGFSESWGELSDAVQKSYVVAVELYEKGVLRG